MTDFTDGHPGGRERILMVAGGSLERYWNAFPVHQKPEVFEILQMFHIGHLDAHDSAVITKQLEEESEAVWADEPKATRSPLLRIVNQRAFNAEVPAVLLIEHFVTPQKLFFIRNHLPIPKLDESSHRLELSRGPHWASFSMADLHAMPSRTVTAAFSCAGNRRSEMNAHRPVKGLMWKQGAVSNARWTGVPLALVLKRAGVLDISEVERALLEPTAFSEKKRAELLALLQKHIHLTGADTEAVTGTHYGVSIPVPLLLREQHSILVAYAMNGEPLQPDHGFPLRAIIPGVTFARSVKWLAHVELADEESESNWQQRDYRILPSRFNWTDNMPDASDWAATPAIFDVPVQSAISVPADGETIDAKTLNEKGLTLVGYISLHTSSNLLNFHISLYIDWPCCTLILLHVVRLMINVGKLK